MQICNCKIQNTNTNTCVWMPTHIHYSIWYLDVITNIPKIDKMIIRWSSSLQISFLLLDDTYISGTPEYQSFQYPFWKGVSQSYRHKDQIQNVVYLQSPLANMAEWPSLIWILPIPSDVCHADSKTVIFFIACSLYPVPMNMRHIKVYSKTTKCAAM